ncbi:hypothetical protein [uncultured Fibrobacter sp.]|uniref:hypothetical protein n=1 Tax=uncultured Fibrobacter sp. TaxID=261512 RepID=UPI002805D717|nr:hypothetical protein [uncultured Fibrobacter sp.]
MEWKLVDTVKYLVKSEMSILRDLDNCDFGYAFDGSNITARLFVLTNVVPFVLFWGGALLPVFTENRIAFVLALVPFLVWTSILRMMGGNYSVVFISVYCGFFTSLFITVLYIAAVIITGNVDIFGPFFGTHVMMMINIFTFGWLMFFEIYSR